ncbi:MAG: SPOR domain-containing protein [Steroidobacteraceae bacterium]
MRAIFLMLLSANLLFLAWAKWIDGPRDVGAQDSLARLPRLQLVTDSPPRSKRTSATGHLAVPWATASLAELAPPSPANLPTPLANSAATTEKTSFRLVEPAQSCTSLGPFNDIASAARAAGLLTQRGFHLQQRAEEGETIEGYWVFVGGLDSDQDVAQVVSRLGKSGFSDAHVMKNYSTNRRISVGMFSSRERAEKRAAAIRNMGLQPEVGERKFPGTVYWVDVALKRGPGYKQLLPDYLLADIGHAKVAMQPCPAGLRPLEPRPADTDGEGLGLPRTTVASAPKVP